MKAFQFLKHIFIKNSSGAVINPATNEKLDEVITAIGAGGGGGGGGDVGVLDESGTQINPATAELQEMTVLLKSILLSLQMPRNADPSNNADQVVVLGTVPVSLASLATLTTLTNLQQLNGEQAHQMSVASEINAWANVQRSTIS